MVLVTWGCGQGKVTPPSPEEWAFELPRDIELIGHPEVVEAGRDGDSIGLDEDLIISERPGDENPLFYRVMSLATDAERRIYVGDVGNHRIQVFDAAGEYLWTLGREGEGPGELGQYFALTVAGDRIIAYDYPTRRLVRWDLEGNHLGDERLSEDRFFRGMWGLQSGDLVAVHLQRSEDDSRTAHVATYEGDGEMISELVSLTPEGLGVQVQIGGRSMNASFGPEATYAITPDGHLYAASVDEYRILALTADGEARWALWVPWPRQEVDAEAELGEIVESFQKSFPDIGAADFDWPERYPALAGMSVDGHGHLYVFPVSDDPVSNYVGSPEERGDRDVDVYSAEGAHLYSGKLPPVRWLHAADDYLYTTREDVSTGAVEVVRYRLVEPF